MNWSILSLRDAMWPGSNLFFMHNKKWLLFCTSIETMRSSFVFSNWMKIVQLSSPLLSMLQKFPSKWYLQAQFIVSETWRKVAFQFFLNWNFISLSSPMVFSCRVICLKILLHTSETQNFYVTLISGITWNTRNEKGSSGKVMSVWWQTISNSGIKRH